MTIKEFLKTFELFADAPSAVDKMRELIFEIAVRGGLTTRDESDQTDPAWREFIKDFDSRNYDYDPGPPAPFEIPERWRWVCLEDLGETKVRNNIPDRTRVSFVPMALVPAKYGALVLPEERSWGEVKKGFTHFANGDVVLAKITPCFENGKAAVMRNLKNGFGAGTTELHVFRRRTKAVLPEFVLVYLKSRGFIERGERRMTGTAGQKRVPYEYFAGSDFPLPPPGEQKRIVAKVDELMGLCDRLEAQQAQREKRHAALAEASLARFSEAPTPANLNLLFHKSYDIDPADLRKSILTLAVQGKLVRQSVGDEPVTRTVQTARAKVGLPAVDLHLNASEMLFAVPESWAWVRLSDVAESRLGKMLDKQKNRGRSYPYLRNTNVHWFRFELDSIKEMPFENCELDEYRVRQGDVLICEGGHGIARTAVWEGQLTQVMFQKALHRVRPLECLDGHFLSFCLRVYEHEGILQRYYTGAGIPHFTGKALAKIVFPLPPYGEQRRIVAKVNQLMRLVDGLEKQLILSCTRATQLMEAVVAELTGNQDG
jgi:type I restriction enzyme S subunit